MNTRERGSDLPSAAIVMPVLLVLMLLAIGFGRYANTSQRVSAAASLAARAGSIQRTPTSGAAAAYRVANEQLTQQTVPCQNPNISVDTSGLAAPLGTPAAVNVTIRCTAALGDIAFPGMPGQVTLESTMSSPVDTYRER